VRIGQAASPARAEGARSLRAAWLASFAITIVVIAALLFAKSAQAAITIGPIEVPVTPLAGDPPEEDEEEAEADEEAEEDEEELEEEEGARASAEAPEECGLRTARASVVADESQSRVRTQVSYTSFAPVKVAIDFKLTGPKGRVTISRERKRLSYSGVVHDSERLGKGSLARVLAAREVTVTVRVLAVPGSCRRYFDRHLKSRHAAGDRVSWQQSDSVFGG
jgi:hypothetical protein